MAYEKLHRVNGPAFQGPVVRKLDSAIHRVVIFSTATKKA